MGEDARRAGEGPFFLLYKMLDSNIESTEPYVVPETLDELAGHYKEVLRLLGEDTEREGLLKTPLRVAKAMQFLTKGYREDPKAILEKALFHDYHRSF